MTSVVGHAAAQAAFLASVRGQALHHAWLLTGPEGVGKASFARLAAERLLADAMDRARPTTSLEVPEQHPAKALLRAGSHPDYRQLSRLAKDPDKPDVDVARSITIAQVRSLQPMFATAPSMGARRVVLIDSIDDLERAGANALLKNLEEPPAGTIFLLVSHSPGRLLPTIRSRCRLLRFGRLAEADVARVIRRALPEADEKEVAALVHASDGAPGVGLRLAGADVGGLEKALNAIAATGDRDNRERVQLARSLGGKAAQGRYTIFLERAPMFVARAARERQGPALAVALDAYAAARDLSAAASGLSLDPGATVFEMAGIVARLAPA